MFLSQCIALCRLLLSQSFINKCQYEVLMSSNKADGGRVPEGLGIFYYPILNAKQELVFDEDGLEELLFARTPRDITKGSDEIHRDKLEHGRLYLRRKVNPEEGEDPYCAVRVRWEGITLDEQIISIAELKARRDAKVAAAQAETTAMKGRMWSSYGVACAALSALLVGGGYLLWNQATRTEADRIAIVRANSIAGMDIEVKGDIEEAATIITQREVDYENLSNRLHALYDNVGGLEGRQIVLDELEMAKIEGRMQEVEDDIIRAENAVSRYKLVEAALGKIPLVEALMDQSWSELESAADTLTKGETNLRRGRLRMRGRLSGLGSVAIQSSADLYRNGIKELLRTRTMPKEDAELALFKGAMQYSVLELTTNVMKARAAPRGEGIEYRTTKEGEREMVLTAATHAQAVNMLYSELNLGEYSKHARQAMGWLRKDEARMVRFFDLAKGKAKGYDKLIYLRKSRFPTLAGEMVEACGEGTYCVSPRISATEESKAFMDAVFK